MPLKLTVLSYPRVATTDRKVLPLHTTWALSNNHHIRHIHPGQIRVAVYHGSNRHALSSQLIGHDVVITNYETVRFEFTRAKDSFLFTETWARVVLDEGEYPYAINIKQT